MTDDTTIALSNDMTEFFEEVVSDALDDRHCQVTRATAAYVVGVLVEHVKPAPRNEEPLSKPFTVLLHDALHDMSPERFERLRCLGDGVLFTSGFFGPYLEARGVELDFVEHLGAQAYAAASTMLRRRPDEEVACDVLAELSHHFVELRRVIGDVADGVLARSAKSDAAILKLYQRWLKSGSMPLASALAERGLVPLRDRSGVLH